ncbi:MAG: indole-3-glycerol phosphate synthase [Gemmatales bacterium]|nr:MAG: indole-3-glycerol phosphate synthase [Gemmatales bacterium]
MSILAKIVANTRREVEQAQREIPSAALQRLAEQAEPPRDFFSALKKPGLQLIAEVKKASPSAGVLRRDFDPVAIARIYEQHQASAISVLTDSAFFQGSLAYLRAIRGAVGLPLLRKDFIIDRYQLLQARANGADAVLLIAEVLEGNELAELLKETRDSGMEALVELYEPANLPRVIDSGARIIGINNRNLRTFETRLEHTLDLLPKLPKEVCIVSESGIRSRADIERLESAGVDAVLIGETFMRAEDIGSKVDELLGRGQPVRPDMEQGKEQARPH